MDCRIDNAGVIVRLATEGKTEVAHLHCEQLVFFFACSLALSNRDLGSMCACVCVGACVCVCLCHAEVKVS